MRKFSFPERVGFYVEVKERVDLYFVTTGISKSAGKNLSLKKQNVYDTTQRPLSRTGGAVCQY